MANVLLSRRTFKSQNLPDFVFPVKQNLEHDRYQELSLAESLLSEIPILCLLKSPASSRPNFPHHCTELRTSTSPPTSTYTTSKCSPDLLFVLPALAELQLLLSPEFPVLASLPLLVSRTQSLTVLLLPKSQPPHTQMAPSKRTPSALTRPSPRAVPF
jgi:hypothetical protein